MTKEEWKTRCAAQYMKRGGLTQEQANAESSGPRPLAAEGSRSNDGLDRCQQKETK